MLKAHICVSHDYILCLELLSNTWPYGSNIYIYNINVVVRSMAAEQARQSLSGPKHQILLLLCKSKKLGPAEMCT